MNATNTNAADIHKDFRSALSIASANSVSAGVTEDNSQTVDLLSKIGATRSSTYMREITKNKHFKYTSSAANLSKELLGLEARHPGFRIISLTQVMRLAKKYNLVLGALPDYNNEIPEENQKEIAKYLSFENKVRASKYSGTENLIKQSESYDAVMFIVGPRQFFDETLTEINSVLFSIPKPTIQWSIKPVVFESSDPIILNPIRVDCSTEPYFHIVTAWDVEAKDPSVTREIGNDHGTN